MAGRNCIRVPLIGIELAIDSLHRGHFVDYDFLILHYINHKMKYLSPLRVAALTCTQYNRYRSFRSHELFSNFYYHMSVEAKNP